MHVCSKISNIILKLFFISSLIHKVLILTVTILGNEEPD